MFRKIKSMKILNKKTILTILIILVSAFFGWFFYQYKQVVNQSEIFLRQTQELNKKIDELPAKELEQNSTTTVLKTYRNEEYGFEFQYPDDWEIRENTFRSPASKFNLNVVPVGEKYLPNPVLINIVIPEFADAAIVNRKRLGAMESEVFVMGVRGMRYDYVFESLPTVAVDLSFGEYRLLLSAKKQYENVFSQVILTFKFLK